MDENDEVPGPVYSKPDTLKSCSSNYLLTNNYHKSEDIKSTDDTDMHLEILKMIKAEKKENNEDVAFYHFNFKVSYQQKCNFIFKKCFLV